MSEDTITRPITGPDGQHDKTLDPTGQHDGGEGQHDGGEGQHDGGEGQHDGGEGQHDGSGEN